MECSTAAAVVYSEVAPEDCSVVELQCRSAVEPQCRSAVELPGRLAAGLACRSVVAPVDWLAVHFPVHHLA